MPYTNYSWVTSHLAVGGLIDDPAELPFDAILSLETFAPVGLRELVTSGRVEYQWRSIPDYFSGEPHDVIVQRFDEAASIIHCWLRGERSVLVHCLSGVSRSVAAVVWYLMRYEWLSWDAALARVRASRSTAFPDSRLEAALRTAAGETWNDSWLEGRQEGSVEALRADLTRQGTLPLNARIPRRRTSNIGSRSRRSRHNAAH